MESKEILNQFNVFVIDTIESKTTIMKKGKMFVKIIEWKDKTKKKELHYPYTEEVLSLIEENKILLQVG